MAIWRIGVQTRKKGLLKITAPLDANIVIHLLDSEFMQQCPLRLFHQLIYAGYRKQDVSLPYYSTIRKKLGQILL